MIGAAVDLYKQTRKKHDLLYNLYVMRPVAALVTVAVAKTSATPNQITLLNMAFFIASIAMLVAMPTYTGGILAVVVLEVSYCFDCVDGMLARYKKIASKEGHLFDFFIDEGKAVMLVSALGVRLWRTGGRGIDLSEWSAGDARFLLAAIAGTVVVASAISLTNFVRRPELSGKATSVEAHYETVEQVKPKSLVGKLAALATDFLRFLNHYPAHIYVFAIVACFEAYFWIYIALNLLYLARGWLGLILRFGRPHKG
jgi:phosphatidylglycerophosphate synthase